MRAAILLAAFAAVAVLLAVAHPAIAAADSADDAAPRAVAASPLLARALLGGRKRSIFQACRTDIEALCMAKPKEGEDAAHARRMSLRTAAQCLEDKTDSVKDATCKSWLAARAACFKDTEQEGVCASPKAGGNADHNAMKKAAGALPARSRMMICLRSADSAKLSSECSGSDFYKAIVGLRRFHRNSKSAGNGKAEGRKPRKEE